MKPRRVIVTLEIETDAPLASLRNHKDWRSDACATLDASVWDIHQVHVNVVKPDRRPKAGGDSTTTTQQ